MNREALRQELIRDEDLRVKPYRCPAGKLSIGAGRNLDDVGITHEEALFMLENDIERVTREARMAFPWFDTLSDARQRAVLNMAFNMGVPRLQGFKNMLAALQAGDYEKAAAEAEDSRWAQQVGARAYRIIEMIRKG